MWVAFLGTDHQKYCQTLWMLTSKFADVFTVLKMKEALAVNEHTPMLSASQERNWSTCPGEGENLPVQTQPYFLSKSPGC